MKGGREEAQLQTQDQDQSPTGPVSQIEAESIFPLLPKRDLNISLQFVECVLKSSKMNS